MTESATAALMGDNGGGQSAAAPAAGAPAQSAAGSSQPQGQPKSWAADFDEQTSAYVQNKGWQSPNDLLTSYRNLEKFAGGSKSLLELPGPDADESSWGQVYEKLGRPADPEQYDIKVPEGGDPELTEFYKKAAFEIGLSTKQAQTLFSKWNETVSGKVQAMQQQQAQESEKAVENLKREWGQAYNQQIDAGRRAVAALGFDQEKLSDYEAKLGTADMLKLFATLGSKMGEPAFEGGERTNATGFGLTPAAAQQQIADLRSDAKFMEAYMTGSKEHVAKMKRLMEAAYAG
ncbi:hypothetical protein UFOVP669_4 [uncultured Caudovirales phage]|uniref:Uncharacterized protein n=1 Tax=uncultured Caudovirales phage TaxID=2100421 RepID=A0A6J5NCV8_9CAUD|nr:hypothetical protein UFOVP400_52 [uncultured Caudovirales phage]CAB4155381.1 hypothetical protein UFOVP669_4 [uncultured Caudovirales phage]CAB4213388.1 hypothetical protein UFOVP1449_11 [uncultured Caudovirales phage]